MEFSSNFECLRRYKLKYPVWIINTNKNERNISTPRRGVNEGAEVP
jgi:hypothetical protein